jgi:hypothetical protein
MVKLTVNGKVYKKDEPTVIDWHDYLTRINVDKNRNLLTDEDADIFCLNVVKKYLSVPDDVDCSGLSLKSIIEAYNLITFDIVQVFSEVNKMWSKDSGNGRAAEAKS